MLHMCATENCFTKKINNIKKENCSKRKGERDNIFSNETEWKRNTCIAYVFLCTCIAKPCHAMSQCVLCLDLSRFAVLLYNVCVFCGHHVVACYVQVMSMHSIITVSWFHIWAVFFSLLLPTTTSSLLSCLYAYYVFYLTVWLAIEWFLFSTKCNPTRLNAI